MQKRVIGPYLFCPSAQLYDVAVDVAPSQPTIAGQRYPTITAAATYVKAQLATHPHIRIIEPGTYDIGDSNPDAWTIPGYCTISATQPVTLGKSAYTTDNASRMTAHRMPLHLLGANITVDFRYVMEIDAPSIVGVNHWLDGVTLTNSHPDGRDMLWRGGPPAILGRLVEGEPWFTECAFSEVHNPCRNANLVRGCQFTRISQDVVSNARCVVGTSVVDHSNLTWNTDIPAFTVTYTGTEATATLARSGGTESSGGGGLYTARWGVNVATFDVGNGSFNHYAGTAGQGYWFAQVVAWLNTLPGWSATLLINPDRRACTGSLAGDKGLGFDGVGGRSAPISVKNATVTIVSLHDKHGDWYQQDTGTFENVIVYDNTGVDMEVQCIFLSPIANGDSLDYVFFNNAFAITATVSDYFSAAYAAEPAGARQHGDEPRGDRAQQLRQSGISDADGPARLRFRSLLPVRQQCQPIRAVAGGGGCADGQSRQSPAWRLCPAGGRFGDEQLAATRQACSPMRWRAILRLPGNCWPIRRCR